MIGLTPRTYQTTRSDCGAACLKAVLRHYGVERRLDELHAELDTDSTGTSAGALAVAARAAGLEAIAVEPDRQALYAVPKPAILHWDNDHFVLLLDTGRGRVRLFDPAKGEIRLPLAEALSRAGAMMLFFEPTNRLRRTPAAVRRRRLRRAVAPYASAFRAAADEGALREAAFAAVVAAGAYVFRRFGTLAAAMTVGVAAPALLAMFTMLARRTGQLAARADERALRSFARRFLRQSLLVGESGRVRPIELDPITWPLQVSTEAQEVVRQLTSTAALVTLVFTFALLAPGAAAVTFLCAGAAMLLMRETTARRMLSASPEASSSLFELGRGFATAKAAGVERERWEHIARTAARRRAVAEEAARFDALDRSWPLIVLLVAPAIIVAGGAWLHLHDTVSVAVAVALSVRCGSIAAMAPLSPRTAWQRFAVAAERVLDAFPARTRVKSRRVFEPRGDIVLERTGLSPIVVPYGGLTALDGDAIRTGVAAQLIGGIADEPGSAVRYPSQAEPIAFAGDGEMVFAGTLRDNVTLGHGNAGDGDIRQAIRIACADDLLGTDAEAWRHPMKMMDPLVTAPERQLIAIVRAVLRRPRLLVLDSALATLDIQRQEQILRNLRGAAIPTIVTGLSPALAAQCDRVVRVS